MSAIELFTYRDAQVRTVLVDGDPWFVAADVCAVLGIGNPSQAVSYLDDDEYTTTLISSEGGQERPTNVINEPGLYSLILRSRKPEAKTFKRWITHEVLPQIRRTGGYSSAPALPQTYADALRELASSVEERERLAGKVAELEPAAESWNTLATAEGDFLVADAAKILCRDPRIKIGQNRLYTLLGQLGWVYRGAGDGRWRTQQRAIESGWLSEIPMSHYHPRTGDLVLDPPQIRVTVKGLGYLHRHLGGGQMSA
jgi:prophage antirepressor-like protein